MRSLVTAPTADDLDSERKEIFQEAKTLTLKLYMTCIRSVRLIRAGNEHDETEFQERERKQKEKPLEHQDVRLSMLSMLPPVDREDELRSRYEYYLQYTRENFVQESDCLDHEELDERHIARYLHHLRQGDRQRKWLLKDMQFKDPYKDSLANERIMRFEKRAMAYITNASKQKEGVSSGLVEPDDTVSAETEDQSDPDDDFWSDDEVDDDVQPLPTWYKNPRSGT